MLTITLWLAISVGFIGLVGARPQSSPSQGGQASCNPISVQSLVAGATGYAPPGTSNTCIEKIIPITICSNRYDIAVCKTGNGCRGHQKKQLVTYSTCCSVPATSTTTVLLPYDCSWSRKGSNLVCHIKSEIVTCKRNVKKIISSIFFINIMEFIVIIGVCK